MKATRGSGGRDLKTRVKTGKSRSLSSKLCRDRFQTENVPRDLFCLSLVNRSRGFFENNLVQQTIFLGHRSFPIEKSPARALGSNREH